MIFFSLTEALLPDPTQQPETEPNGPERSQMEPKWTEIKPSRVGRLGGFVGMGGVGVVREKGNH